MGDAVALHLKVGEQGGLFLGHSHQIGQGVDVFDENGAQVAHYAVAQVVVGRMAAAEDESLAVEHPALGVVFQIEGHGIRASFIVEVLQSVVAHGDELALVVGCAR